jgi:hypothetical protein
MGARFMTGVGGTGTNYIPNALGVIAYENGTPITNGGDSDSGWIDCSKYASVGVRIHANDTGTYTIYFSADGSNNHSTITYQYYGSSSQFFFTPKFFDVGAQFCRVIFTNNSGTDYTESWLQVIFSPASKTVKIGRNRTLPLDVDTIPVRSADELDITRGIVQGEYIISKFARNPVINTASVPEDIWSAGDVYAGFPTSAAETFEVSSSSANDTSAGTGARTVRFFYYDDEYNMFDSSGNYLFFDVTLNGTSWVSSGIDGMRIWRGKVLTSGSGQINAGDITCRWDTTTTAIFAVMPASQGQTQTSNFTIPNGYRGYLKRYSCEMLDSNANEAQMAIRIRDFGSNTFRLIRPFSVKTTESVNRRVFGGIELDDKEDLVFRCLDVDNNGAIITVSYEIHLVKN